MTMVPCARRLALVFTTAIVVAAGAQVRVSAQSQPRFLGRAEILLYGAGLRVEPAHQTVPKDIATIVSTLLQASNSPDLPPFPPDAVVHALCAARALRSRSN